MMPPALPASADVPLADREVSGWLNSSGRRAYNTLHDHGRPVEWSLVLFVRTGDEAGPPEEAEDLQKTVSTTTRTAKPAKTDPPSPQPGDRSKSVVEDAPRFPAAAGKAEGSNYRTPPLMLTNGRGGNTGLRIERTRSADQKSEASEAMCALAEMSQMCV